MARSCYREIAVVWLTRPMNWLIALACCLILVFIAVSKPPTHSVEGEPDIAAAANAGQFDTDIVFAVVLRGCLSVALLFWMLMNLEAQFSPPHAAMIPGYAVANQRFVLGLMATAVVMLAIAMTWNSEITLSAAFCIAVLAGLIAMSHHFALSFVPQHPLIVCISYSAQIFMILVIIGYLGPVIRSLFPNLEPTLARFASGQYPLLAGAVTLTSALITLCMLKPYAHLSRHYVERGLTPVLSANDWSSNRETREQQSHKKIHRQYSNWDKRFKAIDPSRLAGRVKLIWLVERVLTFRVLLGMVVAMGVAWFAMRYWLPSFAWLVLLVPFFIGRRPEPFQPNAVLCFESVLPRSREQHFRERFCAYITNMMLIAGLLFVAWLLVLLISSHPVGAAYVVKSSIAITALTLVLVGTLLWLRTTRSIIALILFALLVCLVAAACLAIMTSDVVSSTNMDWIVLQRMCSHWWCLTAMLAAGAAFCITARVRWMNAEFGAR